jgi:phenylalanyl-tRNA synthetase beta chain
VIAGIFGAVDAEVDEQTTDLVLEAAAFSGPNVMRTSRDVGWRSEASTRFEKGLEPGYVPQGLTMASRLFAELCGGAVAPGTVDVWGARPPAPPRVVYHPARCDALLGVAVKPAEQADILRRLECGVEDGGGELAVTPPSFRPDLEREVDLIEEVGRLHGLEHVPETLPLRREAIGALTKAQRLRRRVREALVGAGLDEVMTYSFVSRAGLTWLELDQDDRRAAPVALANPLSAEHVVMRTTLLPGLLGVVRDNLAQQNYPLSLFEQGRVYFAGGSSAGDALAEAPAPWPVHEMESLGVVLCGPTQHEDWTGGGRETDFYTVKGVVERALAALALDEVTFERSSEPFLHPGKSAAVIHGGASLGYVGLVRADIAARFGIDEAPVYAAELSLEALVGHALEACLFEDLVTYPAASQDLAVVVASDVPAAQVLELARRAGGKLLRAAAIFDVYEGDQVPQGKRSLALRLTMRSPECTLTDKDIGGVREKVLAALERELGATLR